MPDSERSQAAVAAELTRLGAELDRALMAQDADAAAAVFTPDAIFGESGMEDVVGRPAIRDFLAAANRQRRVVYHRLRRDALVVAADRAVEACRFDEAKQSPGRPVVQERGRAAIFWRREGDGAWRIERLLVSDLPA